MNNEKLNQGLVVMLVAAIVVSIGSTLISLNKLSLIGGITGFATSDTGTVQFQVNESTSIVLTDNTVDFGTCVLNTSGLVTYDSDVVTGNSNSSFNCDGLSTEDYMVLENNGNVNVSVTLESSVNGPGLTQSPTSRGEFWFKAGNDEAGSCTSGLASTWTNISQASPTTYTVCSHLINVDTNDAIKIWYRIVLPDDTPSGTTHSASITFNAVKV